MIRSNYAISFKAEHIKNMNIFKMKLNIHQFEVCELMKVEKKHQKKIKAFEFISNFVKEKKQNFTLWNDFCFNYNITK